MHTVPQDIATLVDAYRTCELLTVGRDGTPVAWPTVSIRRPDGTFLISTSIALAQKAVNVRRDPRVALLFSDPTASGLAAPEQVLVQGTATCPDEIVTAPGPWADLWLRIRERQPSSGYHRVPGMRRLMDWYYMRLLITVTPDRITTAPAWQPAGRTAAVAVPRGGTGPFAQAARRLPEFGGAVLCAWDTDGRPTLRRVQPRPADGTFVVDAGDDLTAGRAALLWHSHDEGLASLRAFVVAGDLTAAGPAWRLAPDRYVSAADRMGPAAMISMIRRLRATADRYLARRGLARPAVPWAQYLAVEKGHTRVR